MADKKISDFTAVTTLGTGDLFELETAAGNSRKITEADLRTAIGSPSGTSFPGSPSSGDRYFRSDRGIAYYYDGTRWLSEQIFTMEIPGYGINQVNTVDYILAPPFRQQSYDIYIEAFSMASINTLATPASNYFSFRLKTFEVTGSVTTNLGSGFNTSGNAQNVWVCQSESIGAVVASSIEILIVSLTETGTQSILHAVSIPYRVIG